MRGKPSRASKHGKCKLTGASGKFVKSHIIPKALTPKERPDGPLIESDGETHLKRQWDSWYDPNIVIRKGEDHLADIDSKAFTELSKHKLIWRSWERQSELSIDKIGDGTASITGLRLLKGVDHEALGIFVVSLFWRAGVSSLPAMDGFDASEGLLEKARLVTLRERAFDPREFPIKVFQFSTKGPLHNLTPMNQVLPTSSQHREPFFRIHTNGAFFRIVDTSNSGIYELGDEKWFLGNTDALGVLCFDFEQSAQAQFLDSAYAHYHASKKSR